MRIFVKAKPGAKVEEVIKVDAEHFVVAVKEPPVQGRANAAIIKALAAYFKAAPSRVRIVSGHFSREKIVEIT
ncbi:DUF167 domain-containing protein [Candidatus Uhrbacteria bacterium]|nr:DUF167 domain-containing protein [Candidatus Uhrbacteria bacterium]